MSAALQNDLSKYIVSVNNLETAEFCFMMENIDFTQKHKDDPLLKIKKQIVNGLLNSCGGVFSLKGRTPTQPGEVDQWKRGFSDQLRVSISDHIFNNCIKIVNDNSSVHKVHILVKRAPELVTNDYGMFTRIGSETIKVKDTTTAQRILKTPAQPCSPIPHMWMYDTAPPINEQDNIEFKYLSTDKSKDTIRRFSKEDRAHRCMLALANLPMGGTIIFGVKENNQQYYTKGQILEASDECLFTETVQAVLESYNNKVPNIWGTDQTVPIQGTHWDISYYLCSGCPGGERRVVIVIEVHHCDGGLYIHEPESYAISDSGVVTQIPLKDWKSQIIAHNLKPPTVLTPINNELVLQQPSLPKPRTADQTAPGKYETKVPLTKDSQMTNTETRDNTLRKMSRLAWSKHTTDWKQHLQFCDRTHLQQEIEAIRRALRPSDPVAFVPDKKILLSAFKDEDKQVVKRCISFIENMHAGKKGIVVPTTIIKDVTTNNFNNILELLSMDEKCQLCFAVSTKDDSTDNGQDVLCAARDVSRKLKKKLFQISSELDTSLQNIHIQVQIISPTYISDTTYLDEQCQRYFGSSDDSWTNLQHSLGVFLLRKGESLVLKNRIGNEISIQLTSDQMAQVLGIELSRFTYIEGPPGSGKSMLVLYLCRQYRKEDILILCVTSGLKSFYDNQGICQTKLVSNETAFGEMLRDRDHLHKRCVIIDDCQNLRCKSEQWRLLFQDIRLQGNAHLLLVGDNKIQRYTEFDNQDDIFAEMRVIREYTGETWNMKKLSVVYRNSHKVMSFISKSFPDIRIPCAHKEEGDEVEVLRLQHISTDGTENGLLNLIKALINPEKFLEGHAYYSNDVVFLVDDHSTQRGKSFYQHLFSRYLTDIDVHGAEIQPAKGLTVDHLDNFSGLDAKVIVFLIPQALASSEQDYTRRLTNPRYKAFVASRAIYRVIFVTEAPLDHHLAECMNTDNIPTTVDTDTPEVTTNDPPRATTSAALYPRLKSRRARHNKRHKTICDITFLPDGRVLYVAGQIEKRSNGIATIDRHLQCVNLNQEKVPVPLREDFRDVSSTAVDRQTHMLAVSDRSTRRILKYQEGKDSWIFYKEFRGQNADMLDIQGEQLVWASTDKLCVLGKDGKCHHSDLRTSSMELTPFVAVTSTGKIVLSNPNTDRVSLYDSQCSLLVDFPTEQIPKPRGVCVDSGDRVLVADSLSYTVSFFSEDGIFLQRLIETNIEPDSMALYKDKYLMVGSITEGMLIYELVWE